jgi:hypothetical protein
MPPLHQRPTDALIKSDRMVQVPSHLSSEPSPFSQCRCGTDGFSISLWMTYTEHEVELLHWAAYSNNTSFSTHGLEDTADFAHFIYIWHNIYAKSASHVQQKWVQINLQPLPYLQLHHWQSSGRSAVLSAHHTVNAVSQLQMHLSPTYSCRVDSLQDACVGKRIQCLSFKCTRFNIFVRVCKC